MNRTDLSVLIRRFDALCGAYVDNPDLLTGLALDEVVGQLKQACANQLGDMALQEQLHRLLRIIPRRDLGEFQRLLGQIRAAVTEHGLG